MRFGKQLKNIRLERGLNQEDIGKIVHMGKSTVSQWESEIHTPNIDIIIKIAKYLDVPLDCLLGRTDNRTCPCSRNTHISGDTNTLAVTTPKKTTNGGLDLTEHVKNILVGMGHLILVEPPPWDDASLKKAILTLHEAMRLATKELEAKRDTAG